MTMKVYVCKIDGGDGVLNECVYADLDSALKWLRDKYNKWIAERDGYEEEEISWYDEEDGEWAWFDHSGSTGCFVSEMEVKGALK